MGEAEPVERMNAREGIGALQADEPRVEQRRRLVPAVASVLVVVAIVIALIVVKTFGSSPSPSAGASATTSQASSVTSQLTGVPARTLDLVGKGQTVPLRATSGQKLLTFGAKPQVLYMGAEYCPYCAAERWAMVVALGRFGNFSNLQFIHSASTDVYPSTPTLTFYGSGYTSKYVAFKPVEMYGRVARGTSYPKLEIPTSAETAIMAKYDAPPFVPSADRGGFPFLDIGNQYLTVGSQFSPGILAKLTWSEVAAAIRNPASPIAKQVDGAANSITAAICKITKGAPAAVCSSAGVKAAAGDL